MPNESEKRIDHSRATEPTEQQTQGDAMIKDLAPDRAKAGDVRGGLADGEANSEKIK